MTYVRPETKITANMGRIRQSIKVDGQECWTLFDTGARNTYVIAAVAAILKTSIMTRAFRTALGGEVRETNKQLFSKPRLRVIRSQPTRWYWMKSAKMKMESRSRFSSAPWRCSSGEFDLYPTKSDSIYHTTLTSLSNFRTGFSAQHLMRPSSRRSRRPQARAVLET